MTEGGGFEWGFRRIVKAVGIPEYIKFVAVIPNQKVKDYLKIVDVSIMLSFYKSESLGVVAVESLAMKVPLVGCVIGGASEVVENGKTSVSL